MNSDPKETKEKKLTPLVSVIDQPLVRQKKEVSLSIFSYLFSELVQYCQSRANSTHGIESRLADAGYGIGLRLLELLSLRERNCKKERNLNSILVFINNTVWKYLFNKTLDGVEKSKVNENEYYLYDSAPLTNKYISGNRDAGSLNCAAFIAGIINGILDGSEFNAEVTAMFHTLGNKQTITLYVIKFKMDVIRRDASLPTSSSS
eukprot:TRINITY_DN1070_c0_g3_i1.p1 TRINITY_DN1070_c0_g3~~TRINITY_DN1070_c0_g3_i1.p1  ORF type:complete len:205 (+),score=42.73 TRINITY_DN1070_c0_g3_i1:46-660(+)